MDRYLEALKKYAVFSGRSRRKEYWMFFLFNFIAAVALAVIEGIVGGPGVLGALYGLAIFIPSLSVAVRRFHDIGRSGWWVLVALVPLVGIFVFIFFMATDSQPGANQYGPNPKGVTA